MFKLLQMVYGLMAIGFAVRDLLANQPIGESMINGMIWPYGHWPEIQFYAMQAIAPVLKLIS